MNTYSARSLRIKRWGMLILWKVFKARAAADLSNFCLMTHRYLENVSFYFIVFLIDFIIQEIDRKKHKFQKKVI